MSSHSSAFCALFMVCLQALTTTAQDFCLGEKHPCTCNMADNSGTIDLRSIGLDSGKPRWSQVGDATMDNYYDYDPCYPFRVDYCSWCPDNLLLLHCLSDPEPCSTLGVTNTTQFSRDENGLHILYSYDSRGSFFRYRSAKVYLVCDSSATNTTFSPIGKASIDEQNIKFELRGAGVCVYSTTTKGTGITIGICIFVILAAYLSIGIYMKIRKHSRATDRTKPTSCATQETMPNDCVDDNSAMLRNDIQNYGSCSDTQSDENQLNSE